MREIFYLDENGEAQSKRIYRNNAEKQRIEKEEREHARMKASKYWSSLSEASKKVIAFCRTDKHAMRQSLGMAQVRERAVDDFYRKSLRVNQTPVSAIKHEYITQNWDAWVDYVKKLA